MQIDKIDKNFKIETTLPFADIAYRNCTETPFKIYGVFLENGQFRRMPDAVAKSVSENVYYLHTNTAGGRVRFKTNSTYVAINAKMLVPVERAPHSALTGAAGFDIYVKQNGMDTFYGTFIPPHDLSTGYESYVTFPDNSLKEVTIHFPLYAPVSELYIGTQASAQLLPADNYTYEKPIVYYGSSITQGGCASRPGNSYQAMLSRWLDTNYINLGFSGSALAEDEMVEYIKNLDMSIFVYDYDHNAPYPEHLKNTHEKMFKQIRQAHPDLPILIMPRPKCYLNDEEQTRFEIVKTTYQNALQNGDKNVYFLDGKTLMAIAGTDGTVDNTHPTDFGFYSMAKAIVEVLKNLL